ncbi:MAG: methylenetetrahydrofolate reductase [NAD(P)H] [Alphaproteobacteria bacterium]|nr:methylenetetrahydrofolate reductase [NAD(P)H] [Alphaproteobacteria bacterium]TAD90420.1 MAG: methylenetetrahydrofolate reductase [NAD(P)H] [Alphaproteobacteria bacterium]
MSQTPTISFEFFPPKSAEAEAGLWSAFDRLAPLAPSFVSVTYGAGGSTRERTHAIVRRIRQETAIPPAAHLTCVAATQAEIDAVAQDYWDAGIRHIVALRGDPPAGASQYEPHPGGYAYASDLVAGLKRIGDFEISVGCYPEGHPEAASLDADVEALKRKLDAGATRAISQYFFGTEIFERFLERCARAGITAPIVPGLLPISTIPQLVRFSATCGATVPDWIKARFAGLDSDPETRKLLSAQVLAEQVQDLLRLGCTTFHFYTLNKAELVYATCRSLGIAPDTAPETRLAAA